MFLPGKILLFGEYAVLKGGDALAIPLENIGGRLSFERSAGSKNSNRLLRPFTRHILNIQDHLKTIDLDGQSLMKDVEKGLWFDANIPMESGLGSSGALVAAVVKEYGQIGSGSTNLLRDDLSILESHFHGHSSGIDPLVSLTGKTILVSQGNISLITLNHLPPFERVEVPGKGTTKVFVEIFIENLGNKEYSKLFYDTYLPLQNKIIQQIVNEKNHRLKEFILELSALQLELFNQMIPNEMSEPWKEGLQKKNFAYKLSGSGGGGYVLRFNF